MSRLRVFLIATAGAAMALVMGAVASPGAPAGGLTSLPTVGATSWSSVTMPPGADQNQLNSISCTSSSFCTAVGQQKISTGGGTLIEQWNGVSWSVVPGVSVALDASDSLDSVSCIGTSFCLAVGSDGGALAETWNGNAWTQVTVPIPSNVNAGVFLNSVSCVSMALCEVLGTGYDVNAPIVFGVQWNGTSLTLEAAGNPSAPINAAVSATGMDCVSATWCVAVGGTNLNDPVTSLPFAELWNGSSWSLMSSFTVPSGASGSYLDSVSCAGETFCQAVGQFNAAHSQNLIETWNGSQWTPAQNVPDTSATLDQGLRGIDCFSATTCSAVGLATAGSGPSPATLALQWNGSSWSIVADTPNQGTVQSTLAGVSCVTNWACVAVGKYGSSGTTAALAMSAPIARTGYRFVASDGGIFSYGTGAPFLGSMGGQHLNKPIVGMAVMPAGDGYYLVASDGGIFSYGSAQFYGSTGSIQLNAPIVGMAVTPDGAGYWLVASDGGIFSYGDAQFYGSTGSLKLNKPIVGMTSTPDGRGYYLVASDGGIFNYGDANFYGSEGGLALNKPVVGVASAS